MPRPQDADRLLVPVAVAAVAVVCCAALPVLASAFAGLALITAVGVGGGLLALIAALGATAVLLRARRRRSCLPSNQRRTQ
jgi:hypothetical protein